MTYLHIASKKETQTVTVADGRATWRSPFYRGWAIDDLKAAVPANARRWDGASKTWSVEVKYLDALAAMAGTFGPVEVEEVDE